MSSRSRLFALVGIAVLALVVWKSMDFLSSTVTDETEAVTPRVGDAVEDGDATRTDVRPERTSEPDLVTDVRSQGGHSWVLEVTLDDGRAAVAARVAVVRDQSVLALGETDGSGCYETTRLDGLVDLLIDAREARLYRTSLTMDGERHAITLPAGLAVAGQVLVDGLPARDPVALVVWSDQETVLSHELPEVLWRLRFGREPLRGQTDDDGRFHFAGLAADWSGRLQFPRELVLEEEDSQSRKQSVDVAQPRTDLLLRLKWRALLRGRVLDPQGEPADEAIVSCRFWGDPNVSTGARTGVDGRFSIPVRGAEVGRLELDVRSQDGTQRLQQELRQDFNDGADLGDLYLEAARECRFEVRAPDGVGVSGARVFAGFRFEVVGEPTDAEGRCQMEVPADTEQIRVMAVGYESQDFPLPPSADQTVILTLVPATRLEVQVSGADGAPVRGFHVILRAEEDLFRGARHGMDLPGLVDLFQDSDATEIATGWSGDTGARLRFVTNAEGRAILYGMTPGVPFHIEVVGPTGRTWADHPVVLQEAERRVLPVVLAATGRMIAGQVLDMAGEPLVNAWVTVLDPTAEEPGLLRSRRRPEGRFEVGPLFASTVTVAVQCRDHAPLILTGVTVPETGLTRDFRLEPASTVQVLVVDEGGVPLPGVRVLYEVLARPEASRFVDGEGETDAQGREVLRNLPAATMKLTAMVGGRPYEQEHHTRSGDEVRFVVPVHGTLQVEWDFPMTIPMSHELRLTPRDSAGSAMLVDVGFDPFKPAWSEQVAHVLPGTYDVQLEVEDEAMDGTRHVLTESQVVVVREREFSGVVLTAR